MLKVEGNLLSVLRQLDQLLNLLFVLQLLLMKSCAIVADKPLHRFAASLFRH